MKHPRPAALTLTVLLASCDTGPLPAIGTSPGDRYHEALLVMLDCRNQFSTAMTTLSQAAPHLAAQQRLEVMGKAVSNRIECERRIDPILARLTGSDGR